MRLQFILCIATLAAVVASCRPVSSQASDSVWPFVRGPERDGHSSDTDLIDEFPEAGPPVLWTRTLGQGYSSFVTAGDRALTQYQTLGGQYLICLDARTGDTVWEHRYANAFETAGLYPGPRSTPTVADDCAYFSAPDGTVGCVSLDNGAPIWQVNVFERFEVEPVEFGYSCSPVVLDNLVLLPVGANGATMVALDSASGKTVWQSGNEPISHVPAFPIELASRQLVIGYLRNSLMAFDLKSGDIIWKHALSSGYDEHAAWPIYREPHLWLSGPFRSGCEQFELISEPPGLRRIWRSNLMSNDVCSSVLVGDCLYGFDIRDVQSKVHRPSRGVFRCIEWGSGESRWSQGADDIRRTLDGSIQRSRNRASGEVPVGQASVIYADGKLILFNDLGELILLRADPDVFVELGRVRVLGGEICWTSPALSEGRLFVRNHSRAACLLLKEPAKAGDDLQFATLTVADIPQSSYFDWAAFLIPIEPEYAMDAPKLSWLVLWFQVCFVGLLGSAFLSAMLESGRSRWSRRKRNGSMQCLHESGVTTAGADQGGEIQAGSITQPSDVESENTNGVNLEAARLETDGSNLPARVHTAETHIPPHENRSVFQLTFFVLAGTFGMLGTTCVSQLMERFVFTWPLTLFVLLSIVVGAVETRRAVNSPGRWRGYLVLAAFLLACVTYYYLCRRLSLAFEWVFLVGFPAAILPLMFARQQSCTSGRGFVIASALIAVAFAAYFWASAAVLLYRY